VSPGNKKVVVSPRVMLSMLGSEFSCFLELLVVGASVGGGGDSNCLEAEHGGDWRASH
jgi:hypothetical protein